jgi:hypothetical protein
MISPKALRMINPTPEQAVALAALSAVYDKSPTAISNLLAKYGQSFTGNPVIDFVQLSELKNARSFNQDLRNAFQQARGFDLPFNIDLSGISDSVGDFIDKAKPMAGQILQMGAPIIGMAASAGANAAAPGSGAIAGPLATGGANALGGYLNPSKPSTQAPSPQAPAPGSSGMTPQQMALLQTALANSGQSKAASEELLKQMLKDKATDTGLILGMAKKTFYIVLVGFVIVVVIVIVTIVLIRRAKKNKLKSAA